MIRFAAACLGTAVLLALPAAAVAQPAGIKTLQLSKVVLDTETSEVVARVKGGTLCVFPSNVKLPKEKKTQDYERYDNLFSAGLKSGGFTVVSTSGDMFAAADDNNKADYLVGVTLRPLEMNLCSSIKGEKGKVSMAADWQLYDRAAGKIVETLTTTGEGALEKFASDGLDQMVNAAFAANLDALVKQGVVQKYAPPAPDSQP